MSIERLCDCPECHGYDDMRVINQWADGTWEPYAQIDRGDYVWDICEHCLNGTYGCTYWQVRVLPQPTQMQLMMQDIWNPVIYKQLEAGILLRDWDKYTQNRMKHAKDTKGRTVTFTIHQTRED